MSFKEIMKLLLKSLLIVLVGIIGACIVCALTVLILTGHFILAIILTVGVVFTVEL